MKNHITGLGGLRVLSILIVIASHFYRNHFFSDNVLLRQAGILIFNGQLGVGIFFIISGFLITTLLIKEKEAKYSISLKKFYIRRTLRIFPAYYFLLFIYFILQCFEFIHLDSRDWFSSLTYTKQFFSGTSHLNGHLWSLSVEEVFYLIWPFIFVKFGKASGSIAFFLVFVITVSRFFQFKYPVPILTSGIFSTGDALLVGCLVAIYYEKVLLFVTRLGKWNNLLFPLLIVSVYIYAYFFHLLGNSQSFILQKIYSPLSYSLFGNMGLVTNILIALIIVYSINMKTIWSGFLNLPFMEYIGKLSYSIYLWQQFFTDDRPFFHKLPVVLLLIFIGIAALFSYYLIEKPFLKLKGKFS